jgi:predicted RND superfamily exporter protein
MAYADMGIPQSDYTLTNLFVLYQDILARLLESQINTILLVYLVLWLVMLCIFRSPRISTIALLPNIVVTVFILGLMGWAGIPLDLMTITIAAIAMGISIDDTIHFIHHYIHSEGNDVKERLHYCFRTVGYALLYTSIVIAAGFSVLGFSEFVPSIVFGLLTAVAMLMALVTNVTLLPILLSKYVRKFS